MSTAHPATPSAPSAPPDQALIARTVQAQVAPGSVLRSVAPLAGDASNRRYYRIQLDGGPPYSVILMQLAEPEAFKQSEEAVSGSTHQIGELPFLNILAHLSKAGIPVPRLYYYDQAEGLLYLEDFGDLTLAEEAGRSDERVVESRYKAAIDVLV